MLRAAVAHPDNATPPNAPTWRPAGRRNRAWKTTKIREHEYPRKAPRPIASGISFRDGDLGSARAVELIKVCDFYEAKASGAYVDSALSGRYVHAMAREVRALACALKEAEHEQQGRVRALELVCREWDDHFGPKADGRGRLDESQGELRVVPVTPASLHAERAWLIERVDKANAAARDAEAALAARDAAAKEELAEHQRAARSFAARQRARLDLDLDKLRSDLDARLARDAANAARRDLAAQGLDGAAGARLRAASAAREQKLASEAHGARATNQELREELAKTKAALAATRAALGASTRDNEEYSAIRQQVVADAFAAATATSRANQRSAGTQCGPEGRLRFAAAPRGPRAITARKVLASRVPPALAVAFPALVRSELNVALLSAAPRPDLTAPDGAVALELTCATPEDAARLLEADGKLDADADAFLTPAVVAEPAPVRRFDVELLRASPAPDPPVPSRSPFDFPLPPPATAATAARKPRATADDIRGRLSAIRPVVHSATAKHFR